MANVAFDIDGTLTDYTGFIERYLPVFAKETAIKVQANPASISGAYWPKITFLYLLRKTVNLDTGYWTLKPVSVLSPGESMTGFWEAIKTQSTPLL